MDAVKSRLSALTPFARKHKVTVIGSGNWGSTISKVVAENTAEHPEIFERDVQMWVYEEEVELDPKSKHYDPDSPLCQGPQKLTTLINAFHENVKYLPGIALPSNVVANPSLTDAVKDSSILIFNLPHQFIRGLCQQLRDHITPYARGISCIKGVDVRGSSISLFSETIGQELGIYCGVLSGANIANEVAQEKFSETTIAYDPPPMDSQAPTPATSQRSSPVSSQVDLTRLVHKDATGQPSRVKLRPLPSEYHPIDQSTIKKLFHRRYFHIRVVSDVAGVSLGGALKNVIAVAAGWVDGLGWGDNAKAAVMRVGLLEMRAFGMRFFPHTIQPDTFTVESAGVADLITTCSGGRNWRCAKMSIQEGKTIEEIEARELNGQKLQGAGTAAEVNTFLKSQGMERDFPLMTAVYNILKGHEKAEHLPDLIEPDDEFSPTLPSPLSNPPEVSPNPRRADTTSAPALTVRDSALSPLIPAPSISSGRYNRQVILPQVRVAGQARLAASRVLVIGLGGLGCPAAMYLAGAGIGTLGFMDADTVELSNLHRQIAHSEAAAARHMLKVESARLRCRDINADIRYVVHRDRARADNILDVVDQYDVVLDCTDNPATRYLINDACVARGRILISGAAQSGEGMVVVLNSPPASPSTIETADENGERGPCYRCVFPRPPPPDMVRGCSEVGILGSVVGLIGTMMATETIKLVIGHRHGRAAPPSSGQTTPATQADDMSPVPNPISTRKSAHTMLLYNAFSTDPRGAFRTVSLMGRRKDCVACGDFEVLARKGLSRITASAIREGLLDYQAFCGTAAAVNVLGPEQRISADDFLGTLQATAGGGSSDATRIVVDVREEHEVEYGPKIRGSVNIPISNIMRLGGGAFDSVTSELLSPDGDGTDSQSILFVCQRGNDSQIAAQKLIDHLAARRRPGAERPPGWVGDVRGGFVAIENYLRSHKAEV